MFNWQVNKPRYLVPPLPFCLPLRTSNARSCASGSQEDAEGPADGGRHLPLGANPEPIVSYVFLTIAVVIIIAIIVAIILVGGHA